MEKLFISADLEGVSGVVDWQETDLSERLGDYFKRQMSREVAAACEAAGKLGVKDILVKDAHGSGRSMDPSLFPKNTRIFRSFARSPYSMMAGIDASFQGAGFIGYHSGAGTCGNPLAHTMNGGIFEAQINSIPTSEFILNAFTAASFNVPVYFLSGDKALCEACKVIAPNIKTVAVSEGVGNGSISIHPDLALDRIRETVTSALEMDPKKMIIPMPDKFDVSITFKKHDQAYRASFYPGVKQATAHQVKASFKDWFDVITFVFFTF